MRCAPRWRILVIEDDRDIRFLIRNSLYDEGYVVSEAEHGRAALDLIASGFEPDLILLDLMMPVMSGTEFLRELRQRRPELPVILITASRTHPPLDPATTLLEKPFSIQELRRAVAERL